MRCRMWMPKGVTVIKAWATEGHSVAIPGLGTMRFGLRAKSVATCAELGIAKALSPAAVSSTS